jgi:hypothetical protein
MISTTGRSIPQSVHPPFPRDIFLLGEFKGFVNNLVHRLGIANRFRPRLYTYADFILVKFYAMVTKSSTTAASESLNHYFTQYYQKKVRKRIKTFSDSLRKRRLVPHQTDVDKFFRLLTEKEVLDLFGNVLSELNLIIRKKVIGGSKMRYLVDNTEYAYYGVLNHPFEVGTNRHQGTYKCRLFQGMALQGCGLTLFSEFRLLRYQQYRARHIGVATEWLRFQGFNISYALMDREFYRAALIKELKSRGFHSIIPAKKFQRVKRAFVDYLLGRREITDIYHFSQQPGAQPWPSSVNLQLALTAHNNKSAPQIRQRFRNRQLTLDEAVYKLAGFFTTLPPWRNRNRWCRFLSRSYKKRWMEETGFRMLNQIHKNYRNRYHTV